MWPIRWQRGGCEAASRCREDSLSLVEGATMRQRSGTVESWLSKMSSGQISSLITKLQKR